MWWRCWRCYGTEAGWQWREQEAQGPRPRRAWPGPQVWAQALTRVGGAQHLAPLQPRQRVQQRQLEPLRQAGAEALRGGEQVEVEVEADMVCEGGWLVGGRLTLT